MRTRLRDLRMRLPQARWGLRQVWTAAAPWTLAWAALLLLQALLPVAQALLLRRTVNLLAAAQGLAAVLAPALAIGLLWVAGQALSALQGYVRAAQAERVQDHVQGRIHDQLLRLDLAFFDRPESYDLLHHVQLDAAAQPLLLLESLGALVQHGLTLLALALLLAAYAPWLPLLLLASAVPMAWTALRQVLREHAWRLAHTAELRRADYLDWILSDHGCAAELRLYALGGHHRDAFQTLRAGLRAGRLELAGQALRGGLAAVLLAWAGSLAGLAWMLRRTLAGRTGLGDLLLAFQAFQQGQTLLLTLLDSAGRLYRGLLILERLHAFLALPPEVPAAAAGRPPELPLREGIRFEGVTFTYPGGDRPALQDFHLFLPAGRVSALVGPNGAGKSTLLRLLCRFYDPQQGRITVDGVDLRDLDRDAWHRALAVLFQEPVRFHASAADNIGFGDLAARADAARIAAAARAAGAEAPILGLPGGYAAELGRWFGGHELSTGEWQRVALARASFRRAAVLALDEPTSAMDPWAEQDWLARFRALAEGRTALLITHRLSAARQADVIHVLEAGRVAESGSHADLLESGGSYAASWTSDSPPSDGLRPGSPGC